MSSNLKICIRRGNIAVDSIGTHSTLSVDLSRENWPLWSLVQPEEPRAQAVESINRTLRSDGRSNRKNPLNLLIQSGEKNPTSPDRRLNLKKPSPRPLIQLGELSALAVDSIGRTLRPRHWFTRENPPPWMLIQSGDSYNLAVDFSWEDLNYNDAL